MTSANLKMLGRKGGCEKLIMLYFVCKVSFKKSENYCIPRRHRLLGQTTKQPLSNFELWQPWKYKQLWGLRPDPSCLLAYKKSSFWMETLISAVGEETKVYVNKICTYYLNKYHFWWFTEKSWNNHFCMKENPILARDIHFFSIRICIWVIIAIL